MPRNYVYIIEATILNRNIFFNGKTLGSHSILWAQSQLCGLPWRALMMKWRILEFTNKTFLKTFVWKKNIFFP